MTSPRISDIQKLVADRFEISPKEMTSARRSWIVSHPRQVAMFLSRRLTKRSLPQIGRQFGNRDHSTVIHALRAVEARMEDDIDLSAAVRELAVSIRADAEARIL